MPATVASGEPAYTPDLASRRAGATNANGELGNGTTSGSTTPVTVLRRAELRHGQPGHYDACGVTTTGAAYCWGNNADGELGNGTTTTSSTPLAVLGGLSFAAVSAGVKSEISAIGKEGKIHGTVVRGPARS